MKRIVSVVALSIGSMALAQEGVTRLDLVCLGTGSANKATSSQAYAWDNQGNSASASVIGNRSVPFDDQVNLWIAGTTGKIRMPRIMLPPIHGGDGGWFEIKSIKVTDNEITGKVGINFINSPKLRIDRITGMISISGKSGDYVGRCAKYDPTTATKAF